MHGVRFRAARECMARARAESAARRARWHGASSPVSRLGRWRRPWPLARVSHGDMRILLSGVLVSEPGVLSVRDKLSLSPRCVRQRSRRRGQDASRARTSRRECDACDGGRGPRRRGSSLFGDPTPRRFTTGGARRESTMTIIVIGARDVDSSTSPVSSTRDRDTETVRSVELCNHRRAAPSHNVVMIGSPSNLHGIRSWICCRDL